LKNTNKTLVYGGAVLVLFLITALVIFVSQVLEGSATLILANPAQWLNNADTSLLSESLATATGVILAVLGIAITVVAIVVELAANRYNHRITGLFIREPANVIVLSLFIITAIVCFLAVSTVAEPVPNAVLPRASFVLSFVLVTLSLLLILPYFAFVISFVSPLNMISKIQASAQAAMQKSVGGYDPINVVRVNEAVDELHDVVRSAMEQSDRAIALAGINALSNLVTEYQKLRPQLPKEWFLIDEYVENDPDFISLEPFAIAEIEKDKTWFEVKVFRQYLLLMMLSTMQMRDIAYLIAINTRRIAVAAAKTNRPLLQLSIRSYNSYLRSTINASDMRTSYYLLNQYRLVAESFTDKADAPIVDEIARHFQFYGQLAFSMGQSFLLEVAAYDVMRLLEMSVSRNSANTDSLLQLLLGFDQEIRSEAQEASLLGVRRAQIQAATMFLDNEDIDRARQIADDLRGEDLGRLELIRKQLLTENRAQYWELTDRGITFGYLEPQRRVHLDTLFEWLR
jgi:hypothetical protein